MSKLPMRGLRVAGLIVMALAIAHCGDSDIKVVGRDGVDPGPGNFAGTTENGGIISVVVGSVESITMICDGETFGGDCDPPVQVGDDGTASGECDGLTFDITFTSNDQADINDVSADTDCDGSGSISRIGGTSPATRTPTPGISEPTPTVTPTTDGGVVTATPTITGGTGGTPCPSRLTLEGQGADATLNTGTTGIAFNQQVIERGTLTVALDCPGTPGDCGVCNVTGPVESNTAVNNHRCRGSTTTVCTADSDCSGTGPCVFMFGSYLPLTSGGVPVCVRNVVNGTITGTADIEAGCGSSTANLTSQVFSGIEATQPCPICEGASGFLGTGTCKDGARDGQSCTVHGTSNQFGNTSFDCPPNEAANIGNLPINLSPTTGTVTLAASSTCTSFPFGGLACYCPGQARPNSCSSGLCTITDTQAGTGECTLGPLTGFCQPSQPFLTCLADGDCNGSDTCDFVPRPCHGPQDMTTFAVNAPLRRTGQCSVNSPTLAATFCVAQVAASAVNEAAGLPGPGTLLLPSKTCFGDETTVCTF